MMTAREMFKELGYEEQFKGSDIYINRKYGSRIAFDDYNGGTIDVVELCYIPRELLKAINIRCQELGWLEEEKPEIKQETNFEHYKDRILDCCIDNLAVVKGIPKSCSKIDCNDCEFYDDNATECYKRAAEWLKQPCTKSTCELTQFEYDLLQSYSNIYKLKFKTMPFLDRMKEKGYFKGINEDETIEDILAKCEVIK